MLVNVARCLSRLRLNSGIISDSFLSIDSCRGLLLLRALLSNYDYTSIVELGLMTLKTALMFVRFPRASLLNSYEFREPDSVVLIFWRLYVLEADVSEVSSELLVRKTSYAPKTTICT